MPLVFQQGTYGPDDGVNRWMGAVAMDGNGNIAVGYSVSDETSTYPGIRYAGRLATDPLNELTQGEAELIAGTGAFQGSRWGDYSAMEVDPTDDCTFWYSQMYIGLPGLANWQTRAGSFKFPSCFAPGYGTVKGTVTDGTGPLTGVHIGVTDSIGGGGSNTDAAGDYAFDLPAGTYSLTAARYGYTPATQAGVDVSVGGNTTQDFVLSTAPLETVSGTVTDGSGGNWPLYAKIVITAPGAPVFTVFTDPVTGNYAIPLVTGNTFRFSVTAVSSGYGPGGGLLPLAPAGGAGVVADWAMTANSSTCSAPGYSRTGLSESFDAGVVPPGWSLVTNSGAPWSVVSEDPCDGFGNQTGGSGPFAVTNGGCNGEDFDDNELHTPSVDMSGFTTTAVAFNSAFFAGSFNVADVDISTDGGSTWTNVFRLDGVNEPGPIRHTIDITSLAAGQPDVRARFHFYFSLRLGLLAGRRRFPRGPRVPGGFRRTGRRQRPRCQYEPGLERRDRGAPSPAFGRFDHDFRDTGRSGGAGRHVHPVRGRRAAVLHGLAGSVHAADRRRVGRFAGRGASGLPPGRRPARREPEAALGPARSGADRQADSRHDQQRGRRRGIRPDRARRAAALPAAPGGRGLRRPRGNSCSCPARSARESARQEHGRSAAAARHAERRDADGRGQRVERVSDPARGRLGDRLRHRLR